MTTATYPSVEQMWQDETQKYKQRLVHRAENSKQTAIDWKQHHNLVKHTIWRIIRKYGGDFDELFSEALVLFTKATQSYDPIIGTIQHWIVYTVYKGLLEIKRTEARRLRIAGPMFEYSEIATLIDSTVFDKNIAQDRSTPDVHRPWKTESTYLETVRRDLSTDSQDILTLLFDMDTSHYKNMSLAKLSLRQILRKDKHWSNTKISNCFQEIEAVL